MKSEWKVSYQYINGTKLYSVYRLKNVAEIDHSGNRETHSGFFEDRKSAEVYAAQLNAEENNERRR